VFEIFPGSTIVPKNTFAFWLSALQVLAAKVSTNEIEKGKSKLQSEQRGILLDIWDEYFEYKERSLAEVKHLGKIYSLDDLFVIWEDKQHLSRSQQASRSRSFSRLVARGLLKKRRDFPYLCLSLTPLGYAVAKKLYNELPG
jgi:hypothetical protein